MRIKNSSIGIFFKLFVIIACFEVVYLFFLPYFAQAAAEKNFVKNFIKNSLHADVEYSNFKLRTHILPYISLSFDKLTFRNENEIIINSNNSRIKISLLHLFLKKLQLKNLSAENLELNIHRYKDGTFNISNIIKSNNKSCFKFAYKNSNIQIDSFVINSTDDNLKQFYQIQGKPFILQEREKKLFLKTSGSIFNNNKESSYEINISAKYPLTAKNLKDSHIQGECFLFNVDLKNLEPYIRELFDKTITISNGFIEYLQFSASGSDNNNIILNTKFNDLEFNKTSRTNYIIAKGENKLDINAQLKENTLQVNSLNYKADKINIKADGSVSLEQNPFIDINASVKESRAENIAALLPSIIAAQYKTVEKIKTYGVYGDIDAEIHAKGQIPQPDITGFVKGRNIHILDKSIHNLHNGTVDIVFDKRILNMDILVDMFNKQKAFIKGYVYMFRDGVNNVSVKTTGSIDFPLAQKLVVPISKVFNFQLGPIPDMNITSGKGIIDVNIKGSTDTVSIDGYCNFDKAKLTYNGLFGEIYDGKGRLDFKDDIISFKSEKAFVKNNPLSVEGKVKINDSLDFDILSEEASGKDLLEIINKSTLLKDVKNAIAIITNASGPVKLFVNIKAKIVPVPFGQPPLPPDEAFEDMKVNGYLKLLGNSCFFEGFYTPFENITGLTNFTETIVDLIDIKAISGTSPLNINGKIITDIKTKIPDVDITVTSDNVNLKDTIKFLTQSYLYPESYPDLSVLYNIPSKHDLYFKYKAKAIDFITDKAYAVMNFIEDNSSNVLKANSGKIILDKSTVKTENISAQFYDSKFSINGEVNRVDTINPIYNLKLQSKKFNLENLNNIGEIEIMPENIKNIFSQFENYKGLANIALELDKNILKGEILLNNFQIENTKTKIPLIFDDFSVKINNNKVKIDNVTALAGDMPIYFSTVFSNIYKEPKINGFITSKLTNNFIKNYFPKNISESLRTEGDISISSKVEGTINNINLEPKVIFHKEADIWFKGSNLGETAEEREIDGKLNIREEKIVIDKLNYIKYISSQNNKIYPIVFAELKGKLNKNKDNIIVPEEIEIKTNKNLSAKIINWLLPISMLQQGTLNCDLKYKFDNHTQTSKLLGNLNIRNIDIPFFDTIIKNIKINADDEEINMNIFGFITDGKVTIDSILENNIANIPKMKSINIFAEQIDNNKLLEEFYKTKQAIDKTGKQNNIEIPDLELENGFLEIKKLTVKSMAAENFTSNFRIDRNGVFYADNINIEVEKGNIKGNLSYDLNNTNMEGNFELNNVDAQYISETLFELDNQIMGKANGKLIISSKGLTHEEILENLNGFIYFDISDGRMPKLGSLEYLLRAGNIIKSGLTGLTLNSVLEILNLVKTGYFSNINGSCKIENGIAKDIEIFSMGDNMSLYINGTYDIARNQADMEVLGKLSMKISTIFGVIGNTSLNTFFKLIPGISLLDFGRKDFIENVEKIPSFTQGDYEARTFQAVINGNINKSGYVQSFKWIK